jgi:hypothetical protein
MTMEQPPSLRTIMVVGRTPIPSPIERVSITSSSPPSLLLLESLLILSCLISPPFSCVYSHELTEFDQI